MRSRVLAAAAIGIAAAALAVPAASASRGMLVGIYDEAQTLYGNPDVTFPILAKLGVQVLRVNLYWGGPFGVANRKPRHPADPADPAYNWSLYDRTVAYAAQYHIQMLFSIWGTPRWANGGKGLNHAPTHPADLQHFAYAAARRYSGAFIGPDGRTLNEVRLWAAWNEPNNPVFLSPQYKKVNRGRYVVQSAIDYVKICNAVYNGVHATFLAGEKVACGVTSPRGNNGPTTSRPSVSPLAFLRAVKKDGLKRFDAWAHHPYYGQPDESPTTKPKAVRPGIPDTAVTLANIGDLIKELTKLYGRKPVWITEYGYQTNPPDKTFGVSWRKQAAYLTQAFAIARRNPRIQMMLWFLLRDEPKLSGWQSGLETVTGKLKPSFNAFRRMPK